MRPKCATRRCERSACPANARTRLPTLLSERSRTSVTCDRPRQSLACKAGRGRGLRAVPDFVPRAQLADVEDEEALHVLRSYRSTEVSIPDLPRPLRTTFVGPCLHDQRPTSADARPLLLCHGFDTGALEYRRVLRGLSAHAPTYAVDLLGSGFTDLTQYQDDRDLPLGPKQIREHLYEFWKKEIGEPVVIVGASLGGTTAMDFALNHPEAVARMVLIDAQGYIDGVASKNPRFLSFLGVKLLQWAGLRQIANRMSYFDVKTFATPQAMKVTHIHCFMPGWVEAKIAFIESGGYKDISRRVRDVQQDVLLLWGRQDKILDPKYVKEYERDVKNLQVQWMENCGHVGHLEKSCVVIDAITSFNTKGATVPT